MRGIVMAAAALFCVAAGPATGPAAPPRVVFLLDASGSMTPQFDAVRKAVRARVEALAPSQTFNVVAFSEDTSLAAAQKPVIADAAVKRRVAAYLDKLAPHGSGNPIPGLRAAFAQEPDEIWLWTDGDVPNWNEVFEEVARLSAGRPVRINTCLVTGGEDFDKQMAKLANESGGACIGRDGKPIPPPPAKR